MTDQLPQQQPFDLEAIKQLRSEYNSDHGIQPRIGSVLHTIDALIAEVERQAARLAEIDHAGFLRWTIEAWGAFGFNKDGIACYRLTSCHTDANGIHVYMPTPWRIRSYMHYDGGRDLPNPEGTLAAAQAIAQAEYDELMKGVRIG